MRREWRIAGEQSGFTLIEVLVAVSLLSVVLGAALSLSDTGAKIAQKDLERAHAIDETQSGLAQIERDLRTATQLLSGTASSNSVEFIASKRPSVGAARAPLRIRYQCDITSPTNPARRACFRYTSDPSTPPGGAGTLVIDQLTNGTAADPVFRPSTNGRYVAIHVARSAAGTMKAGYGFSLTLDHGVYMRNLDGSL